MDEMTFVPGYAYQGLDDGVFQLDEQDGEAVWVAYETDAGIKFQRYAGCGESEFARELCLTMNACDGLTLQQLHALGPNALQEALRLLRGVLRADEVDDEERSIDEALGAASSFLAKLEGK